MQFETRSLISSRGDNFRHVKGVWRLRDGMREIPDFQRLMENLKKYWRSVNERYGNS